MKQRLCILFMLLALISFSQDINITVPIPTTYYLHPRPFPEDNRVAKKMDSSLFFNPKLMHPILGIGPSMLMFFGDVSGKNEQPLLNKIGYNISISEYLSRSLMFSARAMFGAVSATENNSRNLNFKSNIRFGALHLSYNFDKFLPQKRRFEPFVLTGIEYFEYLSKTDLFDKSGSKYFYWNNGSIMSLAENDPNAIKAIS
jgi:hypothetical protein